MGSCPHTARRRRGALLNVLTGGRRGRRAKGQRVKSWRGFGADHYPLGVFPHPQSFAEFKKAINNARKGNTWYEWTGLVGGKDVRLKGYEKWLQIYVVNGVDYSTGMGVNTVREFNEALYAPWMAARIGYTDLPAPQDRFLIGDTGIEAWDHVENPKSGDDPYALELARKAVMAKDWTHPSYAREEVSRAIYAFFPGGPGALI